MLLWCCTSRHFDQGPRDSHFAGRAARYCKLQTRALVDCFGGDPHEQVDTADASTECLPTTSCMFVRFGHPLILVNTKLQHKISIRVLATEEVYKLIVSWIMAMLITW